MDDPIKIKRYREHKFTEKRDNYKNYNNARWKWPDIFIEFETDNLTKKEIAKKYNIKYKTLLNKHKKWIIEGKGEKINNENRR